MSVKPQWIEVTVDGVKIRGPIKVSGGPEYAELEVDGERTRLNAKQLVALIRIIDFVKSTYEVK